MASLHASRSNEIGHDSLEFYLPAGLGLNSAFHNSYGRERAVGGMAGRQATVKLVG